MGYGSALDIEGLRSEVLNVISGSFEQAVDNLATKTANRGKADTTNATNIPGLRSQIIGTFTR
jgi:hypothetical protein